MSLHINTPYMDKKVPLGLFPHRFQSNDNMQLKAAICRDNFVLTYDTVRIFLALSQNLIKLD